MGLHLCYELSLPVGVPEDVVAARVAKLRECMLELPFDAVSELIRLTERELAELPRLSGLAFQRLEDVAHITACFTHEELYARTIGLAQNEWYQPLRLPPGVTTVAYGFGIAVGRGSEPAALGVARLSWPSGEPSPWWWHCCCKTQYASVHGDDHLLHCHRTLVAALETAQSLGFGIEVRDETGYWESRDPRQLVRAVAHMNGLVARLAGKFTDAVRDAGADSHGIQGEIFKHPDFERLEMGQQDEGRKPK